MIHIYIYIYIPWQARALHVNTGVCEAASRDGGQCGVVGRGGGAWWWGVVVWSVMEWGVCCVGRYTLYTIHYVWSWRKIRLYMYVYKYIFNKTYMRVYIRVIVYYIQRTTRYPVKEIIFPIRQGCNSSVPPFALFPSPVPVLGSYYWRR